MNKKWKTVSEFISNIEADDCLSNCVEHISRMTYAPQIGYTSWICRYKDIWVALYDAGNGHYDYCSRVSYIDFIIAKIVTWFNEWRFRHVQH